MSPRALKILQLSVLAVVAAMAIAEYWSWRTTRSSMLLLADLSGVTTVEPAVAEDIAGEPDPVSLRLRAARALLAHELDRSWMRALSDSERSEAEVRGLKNLENARMIAERSFSRRPSSWQAAMVLGGAEYLLLTRRNDPAGATDPGRWEMPLQRSQTLGPGQHEPQRLLSAAYLSQWGRLTPEERREAIDLLRSALQDRTTADLLLARWLRVAPTKQLAYDLVPETPEAWGRLMLIHASEGDWERYGEAYERRDAALENRLAARIEEADRLATAGDVGGARIILREVVDRLPVDGRNSLHLERTIEVLPPGPVTLSSARKFREWVLWARQRCLLDACALRPETIDRIGGLAEFPQIQQAAEAALMAGDLARAEQYERRWAIPRSQAWSYYYLLKARLFHGRGEHAEAESSLSSISAEMRPTLVAIATARAIGSRWLDDSRLGSDSWPATAWSQDGATFRLDLLTSRPGAGLDIALENVPGAGTALELTWDGYRNSIVPVWPGHSVRLQLEAEPGAHVLEITTLSGPTVRPGRVSLRTADV